MGLSEFQRARCDYNTCEEERADRVVKRAEGQTCINSTLRGAKETSFMNGEERHCDLFGQNLPRQNRV